MEFRMGLGSRPGLGFGTELGFLEGGLEILYEDLFRDLSVELLLLTLFELVIVVEWESVEVVTSATEESTTMKSAEAGAVGVSIV